MGKIGRGWVPGAPAPADLHFSILYSAAGPPSPSLFPPLPLRPITTPRRSVRFILPLFAMSGLRAGASAARDPARLGGSPIVTYGTLGRLRATDETMEIWCWSSGGRLVCSSHHPHTPRLGPPVWPSTRFRRRVLCRMPACPTPRGRPIGRPPAPRGPTPHMSELPRHACPFFHHGCESPNLEENPLRRLGRIKALKKPQKGIDAALANQYGLLHRPKARVCLLHPVSHAARGWRAGWLGVVNVVNAMDGRRVSRNVWPRLFWQTRPFFPALISRPLARDCICASRTQPPRRQEMGTKTKAAALQPERECERDELDSGKRTCSGQSKRRAAERLLSVQSAHGMGTSGTGETLEEEGRDRGGERGGEGRAQTQIRRLCAGGMMCDVMGGIVIAGFDLPGWGVSNSHSLRPVSSLLLLS
ncbi:hypothetical protein LZ31DRAFT_69969 [Colletotrichum somersetense]|nr:hypothetical protein LZ31DRAFT_69969 [Colletotrichum somersetense]